jgi:hypothetical protein
MGLNSIKREIESMQEVNGVSIERQHGEMVLTVRATDTIDVRDIDCTMQPTGTNPFGEEEYVVLPQ